MLQSWRLDKEQQLKQVMLMLMLIRFCFCSRTFHLCESSNLFNELSEHCQVKFSGIWWVRLSLQGNDYLKITFSYPCHSPPWIPNFFTFGQQVTTIYRLGSFHR